jgi:hypothetical protein
MSRRIGWSNQILFLFYMYLEKVRFHHTSGNVIFLSLLIGIAKRDDYRKISQRFIDIIKPFDAIISPFITLFMIRL